MPRPIGRGKGKFKKDGKKRDRGNALFKRRKFCRFTAEKVKAIDYKDIDVLKDFVQENGKIMPARDHGHEGALPAPAVDGDQARAVPRAAAVHRPSLGEREHADHPPGEGRQRRQPGRRREGQGRLRAQFPDPQGQGEARDAGEPEAARSEARGAREAAADKLAAAQALGEKLEGTAVKVMQKAGVDGRLFGSVTNVDIVEALQAQGIAIEKAQVRMPAGPLKTVGDHPVTIALAHRRRGAHHGTVQADTVVQV